MREWKDRLGPFLLPVLAAAALGISAGALYQLMVRFGWPAWQAALLPLCVDVVALYGVYLWLSNTKGGEAWRFGRQVAYAALIVSLAGNALEHGLSSTGWYTLGAIGFGSVPPVALFVMVHAYFKVRATRPKPRPETVRKIVEEPSTQPTPAVSRNPVPSRTVGTRKGPKPLPTPHPDALDWYIKAPETPVRRVYMEEAKTRGWPTSTQQFQAIRQAAGLNGHHA